MTSFKATFGLTRSIGGWEEGERRERNKRKRHPVRPGCLFRLFLSFFLPPTNPDRPCQSERSLKARHEADSFSEWSERLTPGQSGWLGAAAVGSIPALALSLFLQRLNFFSLSSTSIFISSRCSSSCHSLLCPAPVRPGCLFRLFLSLLSPSSQPPIDRVSPNVAFKARHEADSFEPAEWSERLTPGQSGWLGAAAVGSIPALALSLFLQRPLLSARG